MRRIAISTISACLALAAGLSGVGVLVAPAEAVTYDRVVLARNKPIDKAFPPIGRSAPRSTTGAPDPTECAGPASASATAYCDWIPFKIEIPTDIGAGDDYYVEVTLDWAGAANLDMWLWDNKQIKTQPGGRKEPSDDGYTPDQTASDYTQITNATGDKKPAVFIIKEPRLVDYNLTVLAFNGANNAYRLKARMVVDIYIPPTESTEPEPEATGSGDDDYDDPDSTSSVFDDDFTVQGGTADNPFGTDTLTDLALGCDPLLCGIADRDIGEDLDSPFAGSQPRAPASAVAKAPGAGVLVLWLVVLPVGLAAGAAALLRRRRLSAFTPA